MAKKLWSAFTEDMNTCIESKSNQVERHHIFYGYNGNRGKSETYGYVIPIRYDLHKFHKGSVHNHPNVGLDLKYKKMAQKHFEDNNGSRNQFIEIFGRSWR